MSVPLSVPEETVVTKNSTGLPTGVIVVTGFETEVPDANLSD